MGKRKRKRVTAAQFSRLLEEFGLRTNDGARLVAETLGASLRTVHGMHSRGLSRNDYELLKIRLYARHNGCVVYRYFQPTEGDEGGYVLEAKEAQA